jgi:hypothetical protein
MQIKVTPVGMVHFNKSAIDAPAILALVPTRTRVYDEDFRLHGGFVVLTGSGVAYRDEAGNEALYAIESVTAEQDRIRFDIVLDALTFAETPASEEAVYGEEPACEACDCEQGYVGEEVQVEEIDEEPLTVTVWYSDVEYLAINDVIDIDDEDGTLELYTADGSLIVPKQGWTHYAIAE